MDHGRLPGHRELGIDDSGQRLDVDDDGVRGVARRIAVARHDDGHRLARVSDDVGRDGAMRRRGKGRADRHRLEQLRDLRAGEHRLDAVHRLGGAGIDRADAAVRDVAALERQVLHAGDLEVVDIGGAPLDQARILAALHALADELRQDGSECHGLPLARGGFAACWMALTMCW